MEISRTTCEFFEDGILCLAEALPNQLVFLHETNVFRSGRRNTGRHCFLGLIFLFSFLKHPALWIMPRSCAILTFLMQAPARRHRTSRPLTGSSLARVVTSWKRCV